MLSVYLEQDLDKLEEFITSTEEYADYEELIMNVRNRRWVPELQQMMAEQSVFAAVGAGHLFGEKGVLNLLAEEGYEVRQVEL